MRKYLKDWQTWWIALPIWKRWIAPTLVVSFWLAFFALGDLKGDYLLSGSAIIFLSFAGPYGRKILFFLLPLILTGLVYESQRYFGEFIRARIRVSEPYHYDLFLFGVETEAGRLTLNEWWQLHTHWIIDLVTGFFYIAFIPIFILLAAYMQFWVSRRGTKKCSAKEMSRLSPKMMWTFFYVNVLGYSTYYWYPAAPPWYVAEHGFGPAKLDTPPNAAGCLRFDEILGTNIFSEFYGRSADVFGAIPSLHCAYPLIAVFFAFRFGTARTISVIYMVGVCFAAVYLNHHYVIDIIWGAAYAFGVSWFVLFLPEWKRKQKALTSLAPQEA